MDKLDNVVKFEGENGESFEMLILKEFELKNKKYAVLMNMENDECDDEECDCHEDKDHCECGEECECNHDDKNLFLLEVSEDKDGREIFKDIEDEEEYKRVVEEAEKVIFSDEE